MSRMWLNVCWRLLQSLNFGPVAQLVEQRIEKTATFGLTQRAWQLQHEVKKVCFTLCDFFSQIPNFSKIQNLIAYFGIDSIAS